MIILTKNHKDLEITKTSAGVSGEYNLKVTRLDGSIRETGWFPNLITNAGLERWGTGGVINRAVIGTGTSTPLVTDNALTSLSASTTIKPYATILSSLGVSPYYTTSTLYYRFPAGTLSGNYTELGLGWADNSLFSKALILDGTGSPTSISVSPSEILDVYYRLRMYPPLTDTVTTSVIGGRTYTVTGRALRVNQPDGYSGWGGSLEAPMASYVSSISNLNRDGNIGLITDSIPSGNTLYGYDTNVSEDAYSSGSLSKSFSVAYGIDGGNVPGAGGVKSTMFLGSFGAYQYGFADVSDGSGIPKDNTKSLTLRFTASWGRYP